MIGQGRRLRHAGARSPYPRHGRPLRRRVAHRLVQRVRPRSPLGSGPGAPARASTPSADPRPRRGPGCRRGAPAAGCVCWPRRRVLSPHRASRLAGPTRRDLRESRRRRVARRSTSTARRGAGRRTWWRFTASRAPAARPALPARGPRSGRAWRGHLRHRGRLPGRVPAAPPERLRAIERRCARLALAAARAGAARLRPHARRLSPVQHPLPATAPTSRCSTPAAAACGDPADDVAALAINYVFFALECPAAWARGSGRCGGRFWRTTCDGTGDRGCSARRRPSWPGGRSCSANPRLYPASARGARDALLGLTSGRSTAVASTRRAAEEVFERSVTGGRWSGSPGCRRRASRPWPGRLRAGCAPTACRAAARRRRGPRRARAAPGYDPGARDAFYRDARRRWRRLAARRGWSRWSRPPRTARASGATAPGARAALRRGPRRDAAPPRCERRDPKGLYARARAGAAPTCPASARPTRSRPRRPTSSPPGGARRRRARRPRRAARVGPGTRDAALSGHAQPPHHPPAHAVRRRRVVGLRRAGVRAPGAAARRALRDRRAAPGLRLDPRPLGLAGPLGLAARLLGARPRRRGLAPGRVDCRRRSSPVAPRPLGAAHARSPHARAAPRAAPSSAPSPTPRDHR